MSMLQRGVRVIPTLALMALIALLTAACAPGGAQSSSGSDIAPKPVILQNTAPNQLDVYVILTLGGYDRQTRGATTMTISFTSGGRPVKFVGDERVTCDGKPLTRYVGAYEVSMPTASVAGKTLTCVYTSGASSASVALAVPQAPEIMTPHDGAATPRAAKTLVTYRTPPGALQGVVATGTRSKALPSPGAMTATQATIDTSALNAGAGAISLTEDLEPQALAPTTFKSLHVRGSAMTMIDVTWL